MNSGCLIVGCALHRICYAGYEFGRRPCKQVSLYMPALGSWSSTIQRLGTSTLRHGSAMKPLAGGPSLDSCREP
jgi:hypothetical protein